MPSKIEWTDETWNPITGCTKCSPGCLNCYAERMAYRQCKMADAQCEKNRSQRNLVTGMAYDEAINKNTRKWTGEIGFNRWVLNDPLHWKKPRRIFVCSMSDLFHPKVPFSFTDRVFDVISKCPQHTFLILTKRPKQILSFVGEKGEYWWTLPNVHLGVSISNQPEADEKIPILLQIPAAVRWLSIEPMLGEIDLTGFKPWYGTFEENQQDRGLHWVVCGGESGPGAREMHPDWPRGVRDQCVAAGVPFFFKQWGEWGIGEIKNGQKQLSLIGESEPVNPNTPFKCFPEHANSTIPCTGWVKVGKKKAGCLLDGKEWKQYPIKKPAWSQDTTSRGIPRRANIRTI